MSIPKNPKTLGSKRGGDNAMWGEVEKAAKAVDKTRKSAKKTPKKNTKAKDY